jgi:hypothetical protein
MAPRLPPRSSISISAALATVLLAACGSNTTESFPLSVGFQPLEPLVAAATCPPATVSDPHPAGRGPIVPGPQAGHFSAQLCAYVHRPILDVWQALQDPEVSRIHNPSGNHTVKAGTENFPLSFVIEYAEPSGLGFDVHWELTYRGGALTGTLAAPGSIGLRFQKTWGVSNIRVQSGSLVATAVEAGVTRLEFVDWLDADTQGQVDVEGTVDDLATTLLAKLP